MKKKLIAGILLIMTVFMLCAFKIPEGVTVNSYSDNVDYMAKMEKCVAEGTESAMILGTIYEAQRNMKIDALGMQYGKTSIFADSNTAQEVTNGFNTARSTSNNAGKPVATPAPTPELKQYYTENDIIIIAKILYNECRGLPKLEQACVAWVILNRVDAGRFGSSISAVATAPYQFAYSSGTPVNQAQYDIALDVLTRWNLEKNGQTDVGRVLPSNYLFFHGDGRHNYFKTAERSGSYWDYSLPNPYN